jgi:hypothetical protein
MTNSFGRDLLFRMPGIIVSDPQIVPAWRPLSLPATQKPGCTRKKDFSAEPVRAFNLI